MLPVSVLAGPRRMLKWTPMKSSALEPSGPNRSASPPLPIPTRARTSALGGYVTGNGVGLGRGAVRRSETFIIPIASCFQGTILALTPAMLPTAGSVARGH
jgi:hypothetical protein